MYDQELVLSLQHSLSPYFGHIGLCFRASQPKRNKQNNDKYKRTQGKPHNKFCGCTSFGSFPVSQKSSAQSPTPGRLGMKHERDWTAYIPFINNSTSSRQFSKHTVMRSIAKKEDPQRHTPSTLQICPPGSYLLPNHCQTENL